MFPFLVGFIFVFWLDSHLFLLARWATCDVVGWFANAVICLIIARKHADVRSACLVRARISLWLCGGLNAARDHEASCLVVANFSGEGVSFQVKPPGTRVP